jgi:Domain of unknown function (DUF4136)
MLGALGGDTPIEHNGETTMNIRRPSLSLAALACWVALVATGCETFSVTTDYDKSIDFGRYHTFSWVSKNPLVSKSADVSPLTEGRIETAVKSVLTQKGFQFVDDPAKADFAVAFTLGSRQELRVTSNPYSTSWGAAPYMWGAPYYRDIDVRQYTKGRLAIDFFDVKLREPVWHGHASKSITESDRANAAQVIDKAVAEILKSFPPA